MDPTTLQLYGRGTGTSGGGDATRTRNDLITLARAVPYIGSAPPAVGERIANQTLWYDTTRLPPLQKLWNGTDWWVLAGGRAVSAFAWKAAGPAQTVGSGAIRNSNLLTFDSKYDPDGLFVGSNQFVAPWSGLWGITVQVFWQGVNNIGVREFGIIFTSGGVTALYRLGDAVGIAPNNNPLGVIDSQYQTASYELPMNAGDTLYVYVFQGSGVDISLLTALDVPPGCSFRATYRGPTV